MENLEDKTNLRVTRSLRKRLASVDSDTSSRPGTPIGIKLSSITENAQTDSPLHPTSSRPVTPNGSKLAHINEVVRPDSPSVSTRKSRRFSITEATTPAKTPSKSVTLKHFGTPESVTPLRRSSIRRSVLISDDQLTSQNSKDSTQLENEPENAENKIKDIVKNADQERKKNSSPNSEKNDSSSKSFQSEEINVTAREPVFNKNKEKHLKPTIRIKRLSASEESNLFSHSKSISSIKESISSLFYNKDEEIERVVLFNEMGNEEEEEKVIYPKTPKPIKNKSNLHEQSLQILTFQENRELIQNSENNHYEKNSKDANMAVIKENNSNRNKLSTPDAAVSMEENKSSSPTLHRSDTTAENNNLEKKVTSKLIPTNSSSILEENEGKEITPKKNDSLLSPDKLLRSGKVYGNSPPTNATIGTPRKRSITPISKKSSPRDNVVNSTSFKDHQCESELNSDDTEPTANEKKEKEIFATSWSHNVSGRTNESTKIDIIEENKDTSQDTASINKKISLDESLRDRNSRYESDDNENDIASDIDMNNLVATEDDNEGIVELSEDEHQFVDDEAMDVGNDYQSGDSICSEERLEIEENEIHDDGESIGSKDTDNANGEGVEDNDESDDSFITDDSEVSVLNYSDDDEHTETKNTDLNGNKNYKRIIAIDSSDTEEEQDTNVTSENVDKEADALALEVTKMIDDSNSIKNNVECCESSFNKSNSDAFVLDDSIKNNVECCESSFNESNSDNITSTGKNQYNSNNEINSKDTNSSFTNKSNSNKMNNNSEKCDESSINNLNSSGIIKNSKNCSASSSNKSIDTHQNEGSARKHQKFEESQSVMLEDITAKPKYTPDRKSLNISKQEEPKLSTEDEVKMYTECVNKSNNFGPNASKTSDYEKNLTNNYNENDIDSQNETAQKNLNVSKKTINSLNESDHLNKTLNEEKNDQHETSIEIEKKIEENSEQSQAVSLNKSVKANNSLRLSNGGTDKLIYERSNSPNFINETNDGSKEIETSFGDKVKGQEKSINEKSFNGNNDTNTLRYDTDSEESVEESNCEKEKQLSSNTNITILGEISTDEHTSDFVNSKEDDANASISDQEKCDVKQNSCKKGYTMARKTSRYSLNYDINCEKENSQAVTEATIEKDESLSNTSCTSDNKELCIEEEELNVSLYTNIFKDLKKSCPRKSLQETIAHPESMLSETLKRNSFCVANLNSECSSSLQKELKEYNKDVEKQSKKRKRLSKSFSLGGSLNTTDTGDQIYHLKKKTKISKAEYTNSSTPKEKNKNTNIEHILGRCEEILEAANRAKLEAKRNYNKNKLRMPKGSHLKSSSKVTNEIEEKQTQSNQFDKKEIKHMDDRKKAQIQQAITAATKLLSIKPLKDSSLECEPLPQSKHLSKSVIDDLLKVGRTQLREEQNNDAASPIFNAGNLTKVFQSSAGEVRETRIKMKTKKRRDAEIALPTGIVRVEPVTPPKQFTLSGFRESPKTPQTIGFKVRKILTAGQDTPPKMPSETQNKKRLRNKYNYDMPKNTLPKPQWTQSGVFVEENMSLQKAKKIPAPKNAATPLSSTNNNALQFKQNYLFRANIPRESSYEILLRKERKRKRWNVE